MLHAICYLLLLPYAYQVSFRSHAWPLTTPPLIMQTSNLRVPLWLSPLRPLCQSRCAGSCCVIPGRRPRRRRRRTSASPRLQLWFDRRSPAATVGLKSGRSEVNPSLGGQDDRRGCVFIHDDLANRYAPPSPGKWCERAMFKMSPLFP